MQTNSNKRAQTQTNADFRVKRAQMQANADKRGQTRTNTKSRNYTPFYAPPSATSQKQPAKHEKSKLCETKAHFYFPLLPVGSQESDLKAPK